MARRKKNPGVGTLVGLGLVVLGGYVVYDTFIKKPTKKVGEGTPSKSWPPKVDPNARYAILADCTLAPDAGEDVSAKDQAWAMKTLFKALESVGGHGRIDPENPDSIQLDLLDVLGPPPGDPSNNVQFASAWTTAVFKRTVHPSCLAKLGLSADYAKEANAYGADFGEYDGPAWPADVAAYYQSLMAGLSLIMQLFGQYEMGYDDQVRTALRPMADFVTGAALR